jgi:hypothetical protein
MCNALDTARCVMVDLYLCKYLRSYGYMRYYILSLINILGEYLTISN